jgi:hypothetical protein
MSDIAALTAENALKQQIEHMRAQIRLQQELVAAQKVVLTARDGEVQALRALTSLRTESGSAGATPGSTAASSPEEQRKRARLGDDSCVRSPFDRDELLDTVFSFVGVGDYYFVAGVSRRWRDRYLKLCYNKAAGDLTDKLCTTYRSAFMTAARLQLAFKSGLEVEKLHDHDLLAEDIARYSLDPIGALVVAKTYDMRYPEKMATDAAFYGKLHLLQWLHEHRCPWSDDVPIWAAMGGSVKVLTWLQSATGPWSNGLKEDLLYTAAASDKLDAAKWVKETTKTPWPGNMCAAQVIDGVSYLIYGDSVARWVLARSDCCWDGWDCNALAAKHHIFEAGKKLAAELFAVAHQHGCPCTCDADT